MAVTINGSSGLLGPTGSVIQCVNLTNTTPGGFTISNNAYADLSAMSLTIVPKASGSKILILGHVFYEMDANGGLYNVMFNFKRNGTLVRSNLSDGSRNYGISLPAQGYWGSDASSTPDTANLFYMDTPGVSAGTSLTYMLTVYSASSAGSCIFCLNRSASDSDNNAYERGASSITLLEVAG